MSMQGRIIRIKRKLHRSQSRGPQKKNFLEFLYFTEKNFLKICYELHENEAST
jgi:hypothetical protein